MLPDDVFRSRLDATIASLRYWVPTVADAAAIHEDEGYSYWRITVQPRISRGCPFEIVLRKDQRHDITIAGETYEDAPIESLDLFVPLANAIAEGRVVQRRFISAATGMLCSVETIVDLGNGRFWRGKRIVRKSDDDTSILEDQHFLAYRRG